MQVRLSPQTLRMPPLERFVARHTPLSVVLQEIVERLGPTNYQLVEDYNFPPVLWRLTGGLIRRPTERCSLGDFFSTDRETVRTAMLLEKVRGTDQGRTDYDQLLHKIQRFLSDAGRQEHDTAVTLVQEGPLGVSDSSSWRPIVLIVWSGDRTPLESMIGIRARNLSPTLLRAFKHGDLGTGVSAPKQVRESAIRPRPTATGVASDSMPESVSGPMPAADLPISVAELPVSVAEPAEDPPVQDGAWTRQVVGSTRGRTYRKLLLKDSPAQRRLLILSAAQRPSAQEEARVLAQVGQAADAFSALRDLYKTQNQSASSATHSQSALRTAVIEIAGDGSFRALNCGITPLFWKQSRQRLVGFPSSSPGQSSGKTVRGKFEPGDCLLVLSRSVIRSELATLQSVFETASGSPRAGTLTTALDALGFGKSLLMRKNG